MKNLTFLKRVLWLLIPLLTLFNSSAWADSYALVTDVSTLSSGDQIILVNSDGTYALSTTQNNNNRGATSVTVSNNKITPSAYVQVITLGTKTINYVTYWTLQPGSGNYLYAASSSKNYLRTQTTNDNNGAWAISLNASNQATIEAKGSNSKKYLNWNGSSTIFSCYGSTSNNVKIYKKEAAAYTVTASSNNNSWGTVSVSGTTITADPADCYQVVSGTDGYNVVSGTYSSITHTGTSNTISVTPTANCSIQVIFEKKTVNTYVDEIQGYADIEDCDTHDAPSLDDKTPASSGTCAQQHWHFMGWVTSANKANPTDLNIIAPGTEMTADGTTYYAVWAKGSSGDSFDNTTGGDFYIYATVSGVNYYATSVSSNKLQSTTNIAEATQFTFTKISSGVYSIYNGSQYLYNTSSSGTNLATKAASFSWTISTGSYGSWRVVGDTRALIFRAGIYDVFGAYTTGNVNGTEYFDVEIGAPVEYSDYICTCCTPLGTINGSINVISPVSTEVSWNNVTTGVSSWTVKYKVHGAGAWTTWDGAQTVYTKSTTNDSRKVTITTTCNTAYDYLIIANPSSGYCDKEEELNNSNAGYNSGKWTVGYTFTGSNAEKLSGPNAGANVCGDYSATFQALNGKVLPSDIAVSIGGTPQTKGTDYTWSISEGVGSLSILSAKITGTIAITITSVDPSCASYSFHDGTHDVADWQISCFSYSGNSDRQWIKDFTIRNKPKYYVGKQGSFYNDNLGNNNAKSYENDMQYMQLALDREHNSNNQLGSNYAGVQGTLLCYDNSPSDNLYVDFLPDGYYFILDAAGTPIALAMTCTDPDMTAANILSHNTVWETEIQTITYVNKKYTVGIKADATIAGKAWQTTRYNTNEDMTTLKKRNSSGGFTGTLAAADVTAGTRGKYRIWANNFSTTSGEKNWYAHFVPYFRITYDGSGAEGSTTASADVSCEGNDAARTVQAAANGFTVPTGKSFGGWASSPENAAAGTVAYAAGADVVLTQSIVLYAIWTDINYTVTVNQNPSVGATTTGQTTTAHYNGTINLTTTVPSGYRFVNWTTSDGFSITNSTSATTASFTMPNKNVTVTANFQQTHTVTWNVNGATVSAASLGLASNPVVFDHGASLVLPPTDPSVPGGCPDKVFVGWTSDSEITTETSSEPTLISAGAAVNANVTYRAVFADEGSGGTKWVRVEVATPGFSLSSVSEGQYAIVDADGHAFNGTISSGHGQATATTATFTNNEAPSMPSGYCELTFIKVMSGEDIVGYKMYDAANERYLYAQAASSGQLAWHSSETSYWYWYGSNWEYQLNNATLRVYNHTFRTYGNSSNQTIWLARKTTGIAYDNYITLCSSCTTPSNLAVGSITSTGGTVTWDGVSLSPTEGFKVAWNTSNSVPSPLTASNSADVAAGTNSYAITGLTPATRYYVFVKSKCNDTWSSSTNFYTNAKITYAAGTGATGSMDPKEVTYNTDVVVDACTFTAPTGKTFNGWVSNTAVHVNGGGSTTTAVPAEATINNLTAAITLTAQWRDLAVYHVTFSADNGTVAGGASQDVLEGGTLTFPSVTSTTCGTFSGWVEAAYDNTAAPSGATYHAVGDELAADPAMEGKTYYAVYRVATGAPTTINDAFTYSDFTATGVSYVSFSGVSSSSSAVYAGETAVNNSVNIQLRSNNSTSGIVSTGSGGTVKKVSVVWASGNTSGRTLDVYGKNTAYSAASDLYGDGKGTKLGSIKEGTSTEITIDGDYEYVGLRSSSGAAYLSSITFQWYGAPMKYQTSPACTPVVSMTSSLSSFTYVYGNGPSASQSFTVSGTNLSTNPLVVTAPTNYEVCKTSGGDYTTSVSYTPSDGTVTDQTVYIRLKAGLNVGTYNYAAASGVSAASTGATTRTAALTGSVTKAAGAIAFTDFNAVDHYEAEMAAGASSVDVTLTVSVTGDGAVSFSRSPAGGSSAVPATTPTTTLHVTTVGTWTVTANLAAGTNYTNASTNCQVVVYYADRFYDNLHGNSTIVKRNDTGEDHYTIPSLSDETRETSGSCSETHYHFMGWVPESALSTLSNDAAYDAVMITGGGTQAASGTNYYAVWAEE